ncbi:MAG: hypothetical protein EBZ59_01105 [Planctomycetia bacterium]|nr:hypothetical protein [Planctomycetia bacterium]
MRPALVSTVTVVAVVGGFCGDALLAGRFLGFRDSLHTFPPLYRLVRDEWLAGRVPLWNPLVNTGQPLAATGVAAAFYPPQMLAACALPDGLSSDALGILHLLIGGIAAAWIARDAGRSRLAALVAGLAFAGSGSVLFQVYNPIMLSGAAWMAWAVRAGGRLLRRVSPGQVLALGVFLALAVLAGDPQSAFHAGLVLGVLLLVHPSGESGPQAGGRLRGVAGRVAALAAAAALGGLLAAVQIGISREFMATTTRAADVVPISVWDVPAFLRSAPPERRHEWSAAIRGRPPADIGFYRDMYRYSLAPWRPVECLSPTISGRFLSRWPHDHGWEEEAWVATLYAGVLPLAGAILAVVSPASRRRNRGWIAVLAVSFLAALGGFGAAGAVRHAVARISGTAPVPFYLPGDEVGGVYWMLATFVPGYAGFRYPAKWLPVAALAFAALAAGGFDRLLRGSGPRIGGRLAGGIGVASLAATAAALSCSGAAAGLVACGGLVAVGAAAATVATCLLVHRRVVDRPTGRLLLVAIVACDLVLAGRCHRFTTPFAALMDGGRVLDELAGLRMPAAAAASGAPRITAINGAIGLPRTDDPADRGRFTGMAMRSHTPMLHGWGKVGEPSTAMPADMEMFFHVPRDDGDHAVFARRMFDSAAVEFFVIPRDPPPRLRLEEFEFDWSRAQQGGSDEGIAPAGPRMPGTFALRPGMTPQDAFVKYVRNESAAPRARIAGRAVRIAPLEALPEDARTDALAAIGFPGPRLPVLGVTAVVESAAELDLPDRDGSPGESCRILVDEPRRVIVEATLESPGLVVLADAFHPDWRLRVRTDGGPPRDEAILRVNRLHRGCVLPAGRHELDYTHRSATFERHWPVSVGAWLATLVAAVGLRLRRAGVRP